MARFVEGTRRWINRGWVACLLAYGLTQLTCDTPQKSHPGREQVETRTSALTTATTNVANQNYGAFAEASSTYSPNYTAAYINNGERAGANWGNGGGWNDATWAAFPDLVKITFSGVYDVSEIDIFTVQDTYWAPSEPTPTMTFTQYGIRDFQVQYWDGPTASWVVVPGGTITGNNLVWRKLTFPAVRTSQIQIQINGAADGYSRITEVEAYALTNGWSFVGPNGCSVNPSNPSATWSGTVLDVEQVPGTWIYRLASSDGGLYQFSSSPTAHWFPISNSLKPSSTPQPGEGMAFSAIATKPSNTNLILGGSGDYGSLAFFPGYNTPGSGIWKTTDGGVTWSNVLPKSSTGDVVYRIVWNKLGSLGTVHAATSAGYFRSTDDGQTWTLLAPGTATDVILAPNSDALVTIGVPGVGVKRSLDSGQTWATSLSATTFGRTVLTSASNGIIFAASADASTVNHLALWKMTDGSSWSQLSFGHNSVFNQCARDIAVATDPAGQVVMVGCDGTARSAQGGAPPWTDVTTGNVNFFGDVHVMKFVDANTVLVGDDHGYHYSTDKGATWHSDSNAIPIDNIFNFDVGLNDPSTFWTATQDNGLKRSTDGGTTCQGFTFQPSDPDVVDVLVDPADARNVWATDASSHRFRSFDAGANWSQTFTGLPAPIGWVKFKHDQVPQVFLYTTGGKGIYQSTDLGVTWAKFPNASFPDFPNQVWDFAASRWQSGYGSIIYAVFPPGGMRVAVIDPAVSTTTWTDITTGHGLPTGLSYGGFAVSDSSFATAFFIAGNRLFKTTNRGQNWSEITGNLPTYVTGASVVENPSDANIIYTATSRGIYKTTDGGVTWKVWMAGLPAGGVIPHAMKGKNYGSSLGFKVFVGLWGRAIWSRDGSSDDPP
jgi:hypothetical protein